MNKKVVKEIEIEKYRKNGLLKTVEKRNIQHMNVNGKQNEGMVGGV